MRTLVVGDVHGCFDELLDLLKEADLNLSIDRIIFVGDYIDRGPKPNEVVEYLQGLRSTYGSENVILLRGNHEQMAIDFVEKNGDNWDNWFNNGCETTIHSLAVNRVQLLDMVQFFKSLPLIYTDDYFIYVHAGLRPGVDLSNQQEHDLLWIREEFYESSFDFGKRVIFGHTPTQYINGKSDVIRWKGKVALDTGCVIRGYLSAVEIKKSRIARIYKVRARHSYYLT